MRPSILFVLALVSSSGFAADRIEKIRLLMEAQGQIATFEQQLQFGREANQQQADQMVSQMMKELNPPAKFQEQIQAAASEFVSAVQAPWTPQMIVDTWARYYGSKFDDQELDRLLEFYTTPLARKEAIAAREAMLQFSKHFQELYKPVTENAISQFVRRLQSIAVECKCQK